MKKTIYISFCIAIIISCLSCTKKFLEKPLGNDIIVDTIFSSKQKAISAIMQAYSMSLSSGLTIVGWDNDRVHGMRSGIIPHISGELNAVKFSWEDGWLIQRSGLTANDGSGKPRSSDGFVFNYTCIRQNNLVIENIDKVADYSSQEKQQIKAEMTILNAYRYEEMFKRYGGVPIVRKTLSPLDDIQIPRSTVKETLDYIIKLCDSVMQYLPEKTDPANEGRITKGVAKSVKAEALMFAARPLFNSNVPYLPFASNEQLISFGQYDVKRWQDAITANLEVLNWASSNGYKIINTGKPLDDYGTAVAVPGNTEVLLAYKNQEDVWGYYNPHEQSGGANSMSFNQMSQYYKADGTEQTWPTIESSYEDYWSRIQEMEPRYKVSAIAAGQDAWNNPGSQHWSTAVVSYGSDWDGRGNTEGCGRQCKFWYHAGTRNWFEFPIYRLAENYLNLAEAYNEINNPSEALRYLNVIHQRAGLPAIAETEKSALRKIIQREWATEFYEEGHRYFDVKHWMHPDIDKGIIGGDKLGFFFTYNNKDYGVFPSDYNSYVTKVLYKGFWGQNQYLEPFPSSEVNKGYLKQNPGY